MNIATCTDSWSPDLTNASQLDEAERAWAYASPAVWAETYAVPALDALAIFQPLNAENNDLTETLRRTELDLRELAEAVFKFLDDGEGEANLRILAELASRAP